MMTSREHFLSHYLLVKMFPKGSEEFHKMVCAFMIIKEGHDKQHRYVNHRLYESIAKYYPETRSFFQTGERNSQYGKMWIHNLDIRENKLVPRTDELAEGWYPGRIIDFEKEIENRKALEFMELKNLLNKKSISLIIESSYNNNY